LSVLHDLGTSLDAGDEVDVVYLDFSKAFDSVPHGRLLHKLSLFGIQGPLYAWFTDYLHSRSQRVAIEGTFFSWIPVTSGVPQGSILGPFLFLLYVNDLPDVLATQHLLLFSLMMLNVPVWFVTQTIVLPFSKIYIQCPYGLKIGDFHLTRTNAKY
jgi:hypothetical protein